MKLYTMWWCLHSTDNTIIIPRIRGMPVAGNNNVDRQVMITYVHKVR